MLVSAVSVLVVAQSSSKIPEGLMNYPVHLRVNEQTDQFFNPQNNELNIYFVPNIPTFKMIFNH